MHWGSAAAKATVGGLAEELGFEPFDADPLANALLLESLAELRIALSRRGLGRNRAFRLLRDA